MRLTIVEKLLSLKKILFYPVTLKPASSQSSDFARGWEEVAGKVGGRVWRGEGVRRIGDPEKHTLYTGQQEGKWAPRVF